MIGSLTAAALARHHADRVYIGVMAAADPERASMPDIVQSEMNAATVRAAARRTVLADHTQIGRVRLACFAECRHVEALTSGLPLPAGFERGFSAKGVPTVVAQNGTRFARPFTEMTLGQAPRRLPPESVKT